jgi:hypothetical protein
MAKVDTFFYKAFFCIMLFSGVLTPAIGQDKKDSVIVKGSETTIIEKDSTTGKRKVKVYKPGSAALRSAILPGLGQIYNKKYWKLPIVYGAIGTAGAIFVYNYKNYKDTRFAYKAKYQASQPGATAADSIPYFQIKHPLERYSLETLRYYRDQYRRDIDYSVLFMMVMWGLNVVDAAVDAHLKAFDVSPDLSLQLKPGRSQFAGTNGLSLVLTMGKNINPRPIRNTFAK